MPQDAFVLYHTAKELNGILSGARIEKINQPDKDTVILSMHRENKNFKLLISAHAEAARICPTEKNYPNPLIAPNFLMLLRKHFTKAVISEVNLVGNERIIKIAAECKNELFETCQKELYVEIMGKFSNVIAVFNSKILGALKQSSIDQNNLRPIFPGVNYILPISQQKAEPNNQDELEAALSQYCCGDFTQFIFENIKGISKQTAFEISQRFAVISGDNDFEKNLNIQEFIRFFKDFYTSCKIEPSCNEKDFYITEYITSKKDKKYFSKIVEAVDYFYSQKDENRKFLSKLSKLKSIIGAYEKKTSKKLATILNKRNDCDDIDKFKLFGELILSNLYQLKRLDDDYIMLNNYNDENYALIKIPVDKSISAKQNAERYFKKVSKLKNTLLATDEQISQIKNELNYVNTIIYELDEAKKIEELDEIEEELRLYGLIKSNSSNKKSVFTSKPRQYQYKDFSIFVGKNNLQNDKLTLTASRNDLFVHAKDYHSAHVIIKSDNKEIPPEVILFAAEICAFYSKAKNNDKAPIDYTLKKFVKKPPNTKTGMVFYTNQKTILVSPNEHKECLV